MKLRELTKWLVGIFLALAVIWPQLLFAQDTAGSPVFKKEEIQQLLAPIALYPDELLAQVLMASTYPLQVVQAARWQKENAKLTGSSLDKALDAKEWDPSVKSLVPFPQVLRMMSDKLEWTQKLGDAFLAQQADVMSEVQYLRAKAQQEGSLKSNKQQKVTTQDKVIIIEPASPQVVYVPVYNPTLVYGSWWYPSYPPYYYPPPPGAAFAAGFFWGAAIATSANYWGWGHCDWHGGNVNIDVNRFNNININKNKITSNTWQHNPANRGQVPYKDAKSREQFGAKASPVRANREARGFETGGAGSRDLAKPGSKDLAKSGTRDLAKDGSRDLSKGVTRDGSKVGAGDRTGTKGKAASAVPASKNIERPAAKQINAAQPAAFDVKRGANVRAESSRGQASRQSMSQHGSSGGRQSLGGGGRAAGGGRSGGGRRR